MDIALIGLGNMGRNLALNISDKGYKLHVFNRTKSKTDDLIRTRSSISPYYSIKDLVEALPENNKIIIIMLTTGKAIDMVLEELSLHTKESDVVIDAGNSFFRDTIRRSKQYNFQYVGAGVSGGELGARYGASIMVGCSEKTWEKVSQILNDISITSKYTNKKCCGYFGGDGSGHFVKMLHNGIEYCDMAIISEIYGILRKGGYTNEQISEIFKEWNKGDLDSYLLEIASKILVKKIDGKYVLDEIKDSARQKGTGKECASEAVVLSSPAVTIVESTFSRIISSRDRTRHMLSSKIDFIRGDSKVKVEDLKSCFFLSRSISYIQGFNLLLASLKEYNWPNKLEEVCDIWTDGCILRGSFLQIMKKIIIESNNGDHDFELSKTFIDIYKENISGLKNTVIHSADTGIAIPAISSCYNYILGMRTKDSDGNMIQAMRDCFGAHTVMFKNSEEGVHIEWV